MKPDTARQFLGRFEPRALALPDAAGLEPVGLVLGNGPNALEVAVASAAARPTAAALRAIWAARLAGRATPLLLVVLYDGRAALCGPNGERPPVEFDLDPGQVERLCAAALEEPDRHAALRFLASSLPEAGSPLPGIRNEGFFATHFLATDIPARPDWREGVTRGRGLLGLRGKPLLEGLGLRLEQLPGPVYLVRAAENRAAVAVLLDRGEAPDAPNQRFGGISPLSHAFAKAEGEGVDYVLTLSGPSLRLYPAAGALAARASTRSKRRNGSSGDRTRWRSPQRWQTAQRKRGGAVMAAPPAADRGAGKRAAGGRSQRSSACRRAGTAWLGWRARAGWCWSARQGGMARPGAVQRDFQAARRANRPRKRPAHRPARCA